MPGRPRDVSDDAILKVLRRSDYPSLSTSEVADSLPLQKRQVLYRLDALEDDGAVASRTVGTVKLWWLTDADRAAQE